MRTLKKLFESNRNWAASKTAQDANFFKNLSKLQAPKYLWIGCSDSRVPASEIVALPPGELFVHRNVANLVVHTDFNCLSVIQYAVEILKVEHIIVCGHHGCGGVRTAMRDTELGLIDNWLRHIRDVYSHHQQELIAIADEDERVNKLCEFNVIEQVHNVCQTTIVQQAWRTGHPLAVHGWIYGLNDGLLKNLNVCVEGPDDIGQVYRTAT